MFYHHKAFVGLLSLTSCFQLFVVQNKLPTTQSWPWTAHSDLGGSERNELRFYFWKSFCLRDLRAFFSLEIARLLLVSNSSLFIYVFTTVHTDLSELCTRCTFADECVWEYFFFLFAMAIISWDLRTLNDWLLIVALFALVGEITNNRSSKRARQAIKYETVKNSEPSNVTANFKSRLWREQLW